MLKEISVLKGDDMRIGWWLEGEWREGVVVCW